MVQFQKHQHLELFIQRLLQARNDVEVLKDRINAYVVGEGTLPDDVRARRLTEIEQGSQGVLSNIAVIDLLVQFVDVNMTAQQRTDYRAQVISQFGGPAAQELEDIYDGLNSLNTSLKAVRMPSQATAETYADFRTDLTSLPALINAISYVELGIGSV